MHYLIVKFIELISHIWQGYIQQLYNTADTLGILVRLVQVSAWGSLSASSLSGSIHPNCFCMTSAQVHHNIPRHHHNLLPFRTLSSLVIFLLNNSFQFYIIGLYVIVMICDSSGTFCSWNTKACCLKYQFWIILNLQPPSPAEYCIASKTVTRLVKSYSESPSSTALLWYIDDYICFSCLNYSLIKRLKQWSNIWRQEDYLTVQQICGNWHCHKTE